MILLKNILKENIEDLLKQKPDVYVFTSPSTFYNFVSIFEINDIYNYFVNKRIASIGPVTTEAIEKHNLKVNIEPTEFNLYSLSKDILNYYKLN